MFTWTQTEEILPFSETYNQTEKLSVAVTTTQPSGPIDIYLLTHTFIHDSAFFSFENTKNNRITNIHSRSFCGSCV